MATLHGVRMVRAIAVSGLLVLATIGAMPSPVQAVSCAATGALDRDLTPLTARIVNPTRPVSGTVNATGCDVGVYFSRTGGVVAHADIFGARYYGVLVDGNGHAASADVVGSTLHDLGDHPITAARHGQGVAYRGFGGTAQGTATGNRVWNYQEDGLNATGPGATASFVANVVTGRGATSTISQNGIQVINGATGIVRANVISDLRFLGPQVGNGVLVAGGPAYGFPYTLGTRVELNVITSADVGINVFEADADVNPAPDPTDVVVSRNVIRNTQVTNVGGWDGSIGFQAGISDYANHDRIVNNIVSGAGYDPEVCQAAAICAPIFTDGSIDPIVSGNVLR